jgi:hypothetical protein
MSLVRGLHHIAVCAAGAKDARKVAKATLPDAGPVDTGAAVVSRRNAEFVGGDKPWR